MRSGQRVRAGMAVLVLALAGLAGAGESLRAQPATRVLIVSWDGVVSAFAEQLLREGKLPHLARLVAGGAFATAVTTAFPSKTAAGHATLWTGAPARVTGISGSAVPRTPRSQFTILDAHSGFNSTALRAEPLWMAAARAGRRAVVVQATQGWPFAPYVRGGPFGPGQGERLMLFEGYAGIAGGDAVITARQAPLRPAEGWQHLPPSAAPPREATVTIGESALPVLAVDDPADPATGYDTVLVARAKDGAQVEARLRPLPSGSPEAWSPTLEVATRSGPAGVRLRLFALRPDGGDYLLYTTRPVREQASRPELLPAVRAAAGVFIGNGASRLYEQGALGPTIPQGGDGTAERRYLETVRLTQRQVLEATRWAMRALPWDLLWTYTPYPDEAEHLWRGYLEPALPGHRPEVAARLRPFLEEVYRSCDEVLGALLEVRPPGTVVALVSDHGLEGVNRTVNINTVLQRAGLLALDAQGRVDLSRTQALYPAINNAYILLNTTDRREGIVRPEQRAAVAAAVRRALAAVRDGERPVVTAVWDAAEVGEAMGIGEEAGGDLYLDLAPGYDFDARLGVAEVIAAREPYGTHLFVPTRPSMHTILVLHGPGVAAGVRLREARTIDLAPTLAALLGIGPPRDSRGRVLLEALQ